ncbi:endonuclease/exonuclease/phosphatase family protein [Bacillus sp. 31A1R]|uniref:Endonuclease/exonuclease/phosphatase family protein n=1 Tax=Robertmurraya mangrovi TaxID=3098077 RepID=A0ABU5IWH7_9BACI|nr:endonuclease/exonuclease/phosphatase family protein [Bacillus sp. 31A1R]MDZ5471503.1 endonuclease/exonuclease/phosphatase family protein [Bacillus sp. 31A1R]
MDFKVMTFNIHHGKGTDKKLDLDRIADVISISQADIIGLNEVDKQFSKRSEFVDQLEYLGRKLNLAYFFSPSLTKYSNGGSIHQYGNGILSRFPIRSSISYLLNFVPGLIEGRSVIEASIDVYGVLVNFYVSHLSLNPILHKRQCEFILAKAKEPAVILGDWNMSPHSKKWRRVIDGGFSDVWSVAGVDKGSTYSSTNPKMRLDYIFTSKEIQVIGANVINTTPDASDHLPLITTLKVL